MLSNLALAALVAFAGPSASSESAPLASAAVSESLAPHSDGSSPKGPKTKLPDVASAVKFETKDKQVLAGSYYKPKRSKNGKRAPAALLLHDAGQTRDELETIAVYLHKKGFAVLTIDLRGHGGSKTDEMDFCECDKKAQSTIWAHATRDVDAAAAFLLDQAGVHSTNLSIIGVGASASLAVRRAVKDENVRAVVLVDPQPSAFGYNLANGVADLGGLPTMIITSKDARKVAERLKAAAHDANGGLEYVEVATLKSKPGESLSDKRMKSATAAWLRDQAMPRK